MVILLTMTTSLPLGEVKAHLSELVGRVHDHHERITVTVHGRPSAMLVAVADVEQLEETIAVLRDPETLARLAQSDAELARGEVVSADELAEAMHRRSSLCPRGRNESTSCAPRRQYVTRLPNGYPKRSLPRHTSSSQVRR